MFTLMLICSIHSLLLMLQFITHLKPQNTPRIGRYVLHPGFFLGLKMEVTCSSETLVDFLRTTQRSFPENKALQEIIWSNLQALCRIPCVHWSVFSPLVLDKEHVCLKELLKLAYLFGHVTYSASYLLLSWRVSVTSWIYSCGEDKLTGKYSEQKKSILTI
jgi:hypothetical protein